MAKVLHYGNALNGAREKINFDTLSKRCWYIPVESFKDLEEDSYAAYLDTTEGWTGIDRVENLLNRKCVPTVFLTSLENSERYNLL